MTEPARDTPEEAQRWKLTQDQLGGLSKEIDKAKDGSRIKALKSSVDQLTAELESALKAKSGSERERIFCATQSLWTLVEEWTGVTRKTLVQRLWEQFSVPAIFGAAALFVAFAAVGGLVYAYLAQAGWDSLQTVQGTRPILVLAAVIATLTYGGGLLFSALFSNEGKFEERFRMAREIFLVFSGVFATVVGFHFGQANDAPPPNSLSLGIETSQDAGKLNLLVQGGTPPYEVRSSGDAKEATVRGQGPRMAIELAAKEGKPLANVVLTGVDAKKREFVLTLGKDDLGKAGFQLKSDSRPSDRFGEKASAPQSSASPVK